MRKHTKEPWKVEKELNSRSGEWLISMDAGDKGRGIAIAETRVGSGCEEENAKRIVACVNACKGLETDGLGQLATAVNKRYNDMKSQRDDLLCALKQAREYLSEIRECAGKSEKMFEFSDIRTYARRKSIALMAVIEDVEGGAE